MTFDLRELLRTGVVEGSDWVGVVDPMQAGSSPWSCVAWIREDLRNPSTLTDIRCDSRGFEAWTVGPCRYRGCHDHKPGQPAAGVAADSVAAGGAGRRMRSDAREVAAAMNAGRADRLRRLGPAGPGAGLLAAVTRPRRQRRSRSGGSTPPGCSGPTGSCRRSGGCRTRPGSANAAPGRCWPGPATSTPPNTPRPGRRG